MPAPRLVDVHFSNNQKSRHFARDRSRWLRKPSRRSCRDPLAMLIRRKFAKKPPKPCRTRRPLFEILETRDLL
jgi:hypothetical protein